MSTDWKERFTYVVNNCKSKSEDLRSKTCKDSQITVLQNYNNYYREAKGDLDAYSEMQMTPGLNFEISNKINHYHDTCNNLYPVYNKLFQDECGEKKKTISKNLIFFGVIGIAVLLILIGFFFVKDELMKKVLWGLGGLIILLVGVYFIHQIFFSKKEEKIIPLF